ncbi:MAG: nitrilase family protein [Bacteroidales bacterium]|nr:nitrilase family protein [Bacteroidales bacterium]
MVITLYQQDILWAQPDANRRQAEAALEGSHGDIFVLPETFTTGFGDHMAALAEPPGGPTLQWAQQMAARHDMLLVGTWIVKVNGCCYNRLHWIYPDGTHGHYDKAHTFRVSGEADQIGRGTERPTFEYKGWRIRPAVCYDLRFPKWLRNEGLDYDLLLLCANWPASRREAWSTLLRARAIENLCYVAGCNRTGTDPHGSLYTGDSAVVDYKGLPLQPSTDGLFLTATLDRERLAAFRERWPFHLDFD